MQWWTLDFANCFFFLKREQVEGIVKDGELKRHREATVT
jgi:hypothetical protein